MQNTVSDRGDFCRTLQDILQINNENKKLIKKIETKENKDPATGQKDEFISYLQKQIVVLQTGFEELKSKITNVRGASKEFDDMKTNVTNVTNFKSEFKKSEKISKQFLPDINSIIKCFNECCEKLSNLETNFENVKTATWNTDEKHNDMENKMLKLIEQINSLMLKMVNLEERTKKLEKSSSETNRKLLNLESADVYLQVRS